MPRHAHVALRTSTQSRQMLSMLGFGLVLGAAVLVVWPSNAQPSASPGVAVHSPARPEQGAAQVLRMWDRARSDAWAVGDVAALRRLYVDGASAGGADVRLLRLWRKRGLSVQGLSTQLISVEVLAHDATSWRLRVTDRLNAADVVGPGIQVTLAGPDKQPGASRTRIVELREVEGTWRVASVKPAA